MKLSEELAWRGLIKDKTFADSSWLDTPRTFYLGVDCSADSLTIGNLAVFLLAKRLNKAGWKTVLLVGGATSLIGDPGGKAEERDLKSKAEIDKNVAGVRAQVEKLFEGKEFILVNNYDWFKEVKFLEFLRDVGKHYSMTELMQRDFIADRMGAQGSGISYAEFSYTLIQGYDYWQLYKNHDVVMQIGGSDQWGNMLSGVPLIRKKEGVEVQAFSMPLVINKLTGQKFGKSETGAVWLDPQKTSRDDFYQFWVTVDDANVEDYLKIYTEYTKSEIVEIISKHRQDPKNRYAQKMLAQFVTELVHKADSVKHASITATARISNPVLQAIEKQTVNGMTEEELVIIRKAMKHSLIDPTESLVDVLVRVGLAASKTEARNFLNDKAVYINDQQVDGHTSPIDLFTDGKAILRRGKTKKNSAFIELK